jgi:very-short-patch-repair endonuclease
MGPYILDFYCSSARLAVEVDGAAHDNPDRARHDELRDAWLSTRGVKTLRISAGDVLDDRNLEAVLRMIVQMAGAPSDVSAPSTAFGGPPPPLRG